MYWFQQFDDIQDFIDISTLQGEWGTNAENSYMFDPLKSEDFAKDLKRFLKVHPIKLYDLRDFKFDGEGYQPLDKTKCHDDDRKIFVDNVTLLLVFNG